MDKYISVWNSVFKNPYNPRNPWLKPIIRMVKSQTTSGASQLSTINCQLSTLLAALLLTACTKTEIHYRQTVPEEGVVHIYPDMSVHKLPAQQYYFYHQDGVTPCISHPCDGKGNFSGTLPVGAYHVIASNTTATNAVYSGMESHQTAKVTAGNLSNIALNRHTGKSDSNSETTTELLNRNARGLGDVYRVFVETLNVSAGDTVVLTPTPTLLTRTVILNFQLDEELQQRVNTLSGRLCGVYPSVQLFTGKTAEEEIARAPELRVSYVANPTGNNAAIWSTSIQLFGLHDPKYGENYRNVMDIILIMDGEQIEVEVDLTQELSKAMEQYAGHIPVNIPLQLEIELVWKEVEAIGTVKPWKKGQGGGSEMPIPTRKNDKLRMNIL